MVLAVRTLLVVAVPAVVAILSIIWLRKKKRNEPVEDRKPPDKATDQLPKADIKTEVQPSAVSSSLRDNSSTNNDTNVSRLKEPPEDPVISVVVEEPIAVSQTSVVTSAVPLLTQSHTTTPDTITPQKQSSNLNEQGDTVALAESAVKSSTVAQIESQIVLASSDGDAKPEAKLDAVMQSQDLRAKVEDYVESIVSEAVLTVNTEMVKPQHHEQPELEQDDCANVANVAAPVGTHQVSHMASAHCSGDGHCPAPLTSNDKGDVQNTNKCTNNNNSTVSSDSGSVQDIKTKSVHSPETVNTTPNPNLQTDCSQHKDKQCDSSIPSSAQQANQKQRHQPKQNDSVPGESPVTIVNGDTNKTTSEPVNKNKTLSQSSSATEDEVSVVTSSSRSDGDVHQGSPSSASPSSVDTSVSSHCETNCDAHSEVSAGSADSGRGGSIAEVSSPITVPPPAQSPPERVTYEFDFPSEYCGRLIGQRGRSIHDIKERAGGPEIMVKRKMYTEACQLVSITGTERQIDKALNCIRRKFPARQFPGISYEPAAPEGALLCPEMMQVPAAVSGPITDWSHLLQLSLPAGVPLDALVSSVVSPNHIFLQQPTHPTFPMLERQNAMMHICYSEDVPALPRPIEVGSICAAPMYDAWYRAQVVQIYPDTDECDIRFVDYGGYVHTMCADLRQIRSDFTSLPFQAIECYMANVIQPKDMDDFPPEAAAVMEELVHGKFLQAQVMGHEETDGVPYIQLFEVLPDQQTMFINREIVNRGVARWFEHSL